MHYRNVYLIAADTRTIEIWKREFKEGKEIEEAEENLENLIDDNIKHENEEKYTSNLEKDLEKNKNNDIEDIEAKNKRLMEEEKVFVPSFRGWN